MAADVTLKLKVDASEATAKLQKYQKETERLYKTIEKGDIRGKGLIEEQIDRLEKLKEARKKAHDVKDIEIYNQGIADSTNKIKEYESAGVKAEKQTQSLTQTMTKWVLGLGLAVTALNAVKEAILATTAGINAFNIAGAAAKQIMYNLVNGSLDLTKGLQGVIEAQRELNRLRIKDKLDTYNATVEQLKFNKALIDAKDQTKGVTERIKAYDEAIAHKAKSTQIEIESTEAQLAAYRKIYKESPGNEKALMKIIDLETRLIDLRVRETSAMKEISSMRSGLIKQQEKEQIDFLERIAKLGDDYVQAVLNDNKKAAEEARKVLEAELKEQMRLIKQNRKDMRDIFSDTWDGMVSDEKRSNELITEIWKLAGLDRKNLGLQLNKEIYDNNVKGHEAIEKYDKEQADRDLEARQRRVEAIKDGLSEILNFTQSIVDRQMEQAQRYREILDTRIAETQRAIEIEAGLEEAGRANNLNLKKQELEQLKKERDKALKAEEEAAKRQRQIDTLSQISSLITASANAIKAFGLLAIPIIAGLFGAFAAAKIKAREITKLAKGGSGTDKGIVRGKSHAQGGERFADNIEVERGEAWGVLSAPATHKFGKVFHNMVSSFNKGELPVIRQASNNISTKVNVENSGPNSRLDQVIREQRRLNENLSGGQSIQDIGTGTMIKKGNSIRTIKK